MAAMQNLCLNFYNLSSCILQTVILGCGYINSARTADIDFVVFFGVQDLKSFMVQLSRFQASLRRSRPFLRPMVKKCFQSGMRNIVAFENTHNCGNSQTVVSS